jgi:glycosyltransferase involved in cell wall biosynthesis
MAVFYILAPFDPIPGEAGFPERFATLKAAIEARGHRCVWWTSSWEHARKRERAIPEESSDIRLLSVPGYSKNVSWARFRNHRVLAEAYLREASRAIKESGLPPPDVQLITIPPLETLTVALKLRQQIGGRLVIDLMDRWPDTFFQVLPLPGAKLRALFGEWLFRPYRKILRNALSNCDAVTAQSKGFIEWAYKHGLNIDKRAHVCYLGADLLEKPQVRSLTEDGPLRLAYLGSMGTSYDLETLLRAVHQLLKDGLAVELDLAGAGDKEPWMRAYVKRHGLEASVRLHGYLIKKGALALLDQCHLGVIPMFPESGVTVPYKAGEYTTRGLGVIHSLPGELAAMVETLGAGMSYTAGNVESLAKVISAYLREPSLVEQQSAASYKMAYEQFDRALIYPKMAEFLEEVSIVSL